MRTGATAAPAGIGETGYAHAALLDRSLGAFQLALAGDTAAAAQAMTELERHRAQRMLFINPGNSHPYLTAVNRLAGSRWLLATSDTAGAAELLTWTGAVVAYAAHASHVNALVAGYALYERAAIEERRGRPERAAIHARRFLERVDTPTAADRSRVEHAARMAARRR